MTIHINKYCSCFIFEGGSFHSDTLTLLGSMCAGGRFLNLPVKILFFKKIIATLIGIKRYLLKVVILISL